MSDQYYDERDWAEGIDTPIPGFGPEIIEFGARRILRAWAAGREMTNAGLVNSLRQKWEPAYMGRFDEVIPRKTRPRVLAQMRERAEHLRDSDPRWRDYAWHGSTDK